MKWFLGALLIVISPLSVAYSGTFIDDFSDGNLEGWDVFTAPPPPGPDVVRFEGGHLVMDTTVEVHNPHVLGFRTVILELNTGNAKHWDSYTLTCRIRFKEILEDLPGREFNVAVRKGIGHFGEVTEQHMLIFPLLQMIQVSTIPPDVKDAPDPEAGEVLPIIVRQTLKDKHLRRPIKLSRWLKIKIITEGSFFEFHFDDNLVAQYEDETAVPGTVRFRVNDGMLVHLDDILITGPKIPDIGGPRSVNPEAHLATTWGKIKQPWWR